MNQIGRKIYYDLTTGEAIFDTGEKQGINIQPTTKEQDFQLYSPLMLRNPETVGVVQLEYGEFQKDFEIANSVSVDVTTGELLFNYPVYRSSIVHELEGLKVENEQLRQIIDTMLGETGGVE